MTDHGYICPDCYNPKIEYHKWPAINEWTGDHMGDYEVWTCPKCEWQGTEPLAPISELDETFDPLVALVLAIWRAEFNDTP